MGWNHGYTCMEASVIAVYNTGLLNKTILDAMMEPYKDTDCDAGGSRDLKTNDGLCVEQVICKIMEPEKYKEITEHPVWIQDQEPGTEDHHPWHSNDLSWDLYWSIWNGRWNIC